MTNIKAMFNQSAEHYTSEFQATMDATRQQANERQGQLIDRLGQINNRQDLTTEAKRVASARLHQQTQAQLEEMWNSHLDGIRTQRQTLHKKAFGANKAADPATTMSRRAAAEVAQRVEDPKAAAALISNAQFTGDDDLAKAVAAVAYQHGWLDVVDSWGATNQNAMAHLQELKALPNPDDKMWRMGESLNFAAASTGAISGLAAHEIPAVANSDIEVQG